MSFLLVASFSLIYHDFKEKCGIYLFSGLSLISMKPFYKISLPVGLHTVLPHIHILCPLADRSTWTGYLNSLSLISHYTIDHYWISILNRSYCPEFQTNLWNFACKRRLWISLIARKLFEIGRRKVWYPKLVYTPHRVLYWHQTLHLKKRGKNVSLKFRYFSFLPYEWYHCP